MKRVIRGSEEIMASAPDMKKFYINTGESIVEAGEPVECFRITAEHYNHLPEEVLDILSNVGAVRGGDEDDNMFIGLEQLEDVDREDIAVLDEFGVGPSSKAQGRVNGLYVIQM